MDLSQASPRRKSQMSKSSNSPRTSRNRYLKQISSFSNKPVVITALRRHKHKRKDEFDGDSINADKPRGFSPELEDMLLAEDWIDKQVRNRMNSSLAVPSIHGLVGLSTKKGLASGASSPRGFKGPAGIYGSVTAKNRVN